MIIKQYAQVLHTSYSLMCIKVERLVSLNSFFREAKFK